ESEWKFAAHQTACLRTCGVTRSFTTVAIDRTGTRGSSSCARRPLSTQRPNTFSQTVLVTTNSSCTSSADHTVESRTGPVALAARWQLDGFFASPASIRFGLTLFPVPAHRTGLADFPHPALGKDSRFDPRKARGTVW